MVLYNSSARIDTGSCCDLGNEGKGCVELCKCHFGDKASSTLTDNQEVFDCMIHVMQRRGAKNRNDDNLLPRSLLCDHVRDVSPLQAHDTPQRHDPL
jgi:hypothetical protein